LVGAAQMKGTATRRRRDTTGNPLGRATPALLWLLCALSLWILAETTQQFSRAETLAPPSQRVPAAAVVGAVGALGMTVADMERSVAFYANVLSFEKVADVEVAGPEYEHLQGVFGLRMRVVRMRLGDEAIKLTEYIAPRGRPIPVDSRSQDHWFQHMAIVVSDMQRAYQWLRQYKVAHISSGP